jgi:translocator assembly and maintenance protein 41
MKYGIISDKHLIDDLKNWETLYVAGRMHKPVAVAVSRSDEIEEAQQCNLDAAFSLSLLLLDRANKPSSSSAGLSVPTAAESNINSFAHRDVFHRIAGLSYAGDIRMAIGGEDPMKVTKLIDSAGQLQRFKDLYKPSLDKLVTAGVITSSSSSVSTKLYSNCVSFDGNNAATRNHLISNLPQKLRKPAEKGELQAALAKIVGPASRTQSVKGLFTAGIMKSVFYAGAKFSKGLLKK